VIKMSNVTDILKLKLNENQLKLKLKENQLKSKTTFKNVDKNWDLLNENWNSLGNWIKSSFPEGSGISEIDPVGQLHQYTDGDYVAREKVITGGLPNLYTVESKFKCDIINISKHIAFIFNNGVHTISIRIYSDRISVIISGGSFINFYINTDTTKFYIWSFIIDSDNDVTTIYRNGVKIWSYNLLLPLTSNDGKIVIYTDSYSEEHIDYIRIGSGIRLPPFIKNILKLKSI